MAISDQTIFSAAPLFFRHRTAGYFDPEDHMSADILALRTELGLPEFVQERRYPPIHSWGIQCPDAWLEIVLDAVTTIEAALHEMVAAGVAVDDLPACFQIKEKFGGLRLHWRAVKGAPFTQAMRDAVDQAEARVLRLQRRVP
ncbi:MAG: hypothetical protein A2496_18410 [Burkholderiales bacterium RIFOXYC12_FULL_60_6]|nr:MAG: hypothetical protein A2496_18410 [Burkholderiales bacterium RIFOXYC12_FULL_60_6]